VRSLAALESVLRAAVDDLMSMIAEVRRRPQSRHVEHRPTYGLQGGETETAAGEVRRASVSSSIGDAHTLTWSLAAAAAVASRAATRTRVPGSGAGLQGVQQRLAWRLNRSTRELMTDTTASCGNCSA